MKTSKIIAVTFLLNFLISCGDENTKKTAIEKKIKDTVKYSDHSAKKEKQDFSQHPKYAHAYIECGLKNKAYDVDLIGCRELSSYEMALQGSYRSVKRGSERSSKSLKIVGNLFIEKVEGNKTFYQVVDLKGPQEDDLLVDREGVFNFESDLNIKPLPGRIEIDARIRLLSLGPLKRIQLTGQSFSDYFVSDSMQNKPDKASSH